MVAAITDLIVRAGEIGVFLLMILENVFPLLPSELILPFAGYATATGRLNFAGTVIAGGAGSVLGSTVWYALGRRLGEERLLRFVGRHGRWLALTPDEVRRALGWIRRHGGLALAIGRMLPGVRGVICLPAGISGLTLTSFLTWCAFGSFGWSLLLCACGRWLGQRYALVERWISPAVTITVAAVAVAYVARLLILRPRHP